MYSDRESLANSVDPDQTPQNTASDQSLHCLPLVQSFYTLTGSKMDVEEKYSQTCPKGHLH